MASVSNLISVPEKLGQRMRGQGGEEAPPKANIFSRDVTLTSESTSSSSQPRTTQCSAKTWWLPSGHSKESINK